MSLFQQSVLKKYINDINKENLDAAWTRYQAHFFNAIIQQNILNAKEEEYQEGFVRDLCVNVLGYTLKPQPGYNLVMEQKSTSDATKSDGAILSPAGGVLGVIELKDTNSTDLNKVEKQAFGYRHQHKDCVYVITSNFEKLRLYISDAIDFEEFDLFKLSKERFDVLYCCLQQDALHRNTPLQIKQQSAAAEENITKKLYADYSLFKKQLFASIVKNNPVYNKLELFKKTQKLLDRFLFIFFAEDRLLLPPNSVREILEQWEKLKELDNYVPLYDRFKKYFGYLNSGYQGKQYEIFAYNGGLFAPDDILDSITIDDKLLYDSCQGLSKYDFESEVDVNILGHIFEHSLNEIEEVEKELLKNDAAKTIEVINGDMVEANVSAVKTDKKISKRKKDGVFYTPRYITKYIVENTIGALCSQQKEKLQLVEADFAPQKRKANAKQLLQKLEDYRSWLLQLTICDPACGSGAFLNQALEFLIAEHKNIDDLTSKLFGTPMLLSDVEKGILENNLYGVDINEEATEIAKLSLWLRTAQKGRKLNSLSQHIKCGNSLIDDPAVAGDKAFNWEQEFPEVFAKGGFDVVLGNPPYGASFGESEKLAIVKFKTYKYRFESYVYFIEKGIGIVKAGGALGYITPELWLSLENCYPLRKFIFDNVDLVEVNIIGENAFVDAVVNTLIVILRKEKTRNSFVISDNRESWSYSYNLWENARLLSIEYRINEKFQGIIKKVELNAKPLSAYGEVIQGITPYDKYRGQDPELIRNRAYHFRYKKDETCGKWLNGEDINRYSVRWGGEWLSYGNWLAAPREERFFENYRLLFREIPGKSRQIQAVLFEETGYYGHSITPFILFERNNLTLLQKILCIVNSRLISWYGNLKLPNFGKEIFPKLNPQDIKMLPIQMDLEFTDLPFVAAANIMLSKSKELERSKLQLTQLLRSKYEGLIFTKKLSEWPSLIFRDFLKELTKQKIKLSLPEQAEWMQYFEAEKAKASAIQQVIHATDKEIDDMVYALYGLTEEEIKLVEGG